MGSVVEEKTLVVKTGGEVPAQRRQDPVFRLNFASQHAPQVGEADEALQKMNLPVEMLDSPDDRKQRPVRAVAEKARAFPEQLGDEPEQMQLLFRQTGEKAPLQQDGGLRGQRGNFSKDPGGMSRVRGDSAGIE